MAPVRVRASGRTGLAPYERQLKRLPFKPQEKQDMNRTLVMQSYAKFTDKSTKPEAETSDGDPWVSATMPEDAESEYHLYQLRRI